MTREEILNMKAGREMDALIAENVMCIEPITFNDETKCPECEATMRFCGSRSWCSSCHEWIYSPYKEYSTDIGAAWEVAQKLSDKWDFAIVNNQNFKDYPGLHFGFRLQALNEDSHIKTIFALGENAPLAICRAVLLAVMK